MFVGTLTRPHPLTLALFLSLSLHSLAAREPAEDFSPAGAGETPASGLRSSDSLLVHPDTPLAGENLPAGRFDRNERDFVICRPLDPTGAATLSPAAARNNEIVGTLTGAGKDDAAILRQAVAGFEAGLGGDPLFLPYLYNAGRLHALLGDHARASRYFEKAREQVPELAALHRHLGRSYAALGDERAALASYREAATRDPFDVGALVDLGDYYRERDTAERARYYYEAALESQPYSVDAQLGLARLEIAAGAWMAARSRLRRLVLSDPAAPNTFESRQVNPAVHYWRAQIAVHLNAFDEAVLEFDALLAKADAAFFLETSRRSVERERDAARASRAGVRR